MRHQLRSENPHTRDRRLGHPAKANDNAPFEAQGKEAQRAQRYAPGQKPIWVRPRSVRSSFAMMANGNAKFVEIDASGGHGTVGSGTMEKVDTTAFSTAKIAGDYAFGVVGFDPSNNRSAIAGRFTASGAGTFTNGAADMNLSGTFSTLNVFV